MKRSRIFVSILAAAAAALTAGSLTGCASTSGTLETHGAAAQLIVKYAAMKYVEQASLSERGERARRVMDVAKLVAETAKGEPITLQRLASIAAEQLPADLPPSDRTLALALISVAQTELQKRTGVGGLESDTLLKLAEVLGWIADAAALYAAPV